MALLEKSLRRIDRKDASQTRRRQSGALQVAARSSGTLSPHQKMHLSAFETREMTGKASACVLACIVLVSAADAQNVVGEFGEGAIAERVSIDPKRVEQMVLTFPKPGMAIPSHPEAKRVAEKLDRHVQALIAGWPWKPFQHTLGISGFETCFDHPDELFYALSLALPCLAEPTRVSTAKLLQDLAASHPPYAIDGFARDQGRPRERYDVPPDLRPNGARPAESVFGVFAFWVYQNSAGDWREPVEIDRHWPALRTRIEPLLKADYIFDPVRRDDAHDQVEKLNGDLAGLIGFARLAAVRRDERETARALSRIRQLAQWRLDHERLNPRLTAKTNAASKGLHHFKLARFCDFSAPLAALFDDSTRALAATRLRAFRTARNGWWMAFGDRLIGGENYTNPTHFSRALFAGGALVEQLPSEELCRWVDIPWCEADLYFIEKCALALGAN